MKRAIAAARVQGMRVNLFRRKFSSPHPAKNSRSSSRWRAEVGRFVTAGRDRRLTVRWRGFKPDLLHAMVSGPNNDASFLGPLAKRSLE